MHGALTDYYIAVDGSPDWGAATSNTTPCSLSTWFANATAGCRGNIKAGTYTRTATDTVTADGTAVSPIVMRGCDASWNPLSPSRAAGTRLLSDTNYPVINYNGNYLLSAPAANYWSWQCLKITGLRQGPQVDIGTYDYLYGLIIESNADNASAGGIYTRIGNIIDNCDIAQTGANGAYAVYVQGANVRICNTTVYDTAGIGVQIEAGTAILDHVLIYGHTGYGITLNSSAGNFWHLTSTTIYGGKGVYCNVAFTSLSWFGVSHITDGGEYAFLNADATGSPIILSGVRTRDNTSGRISWVGDFVFDFGAITTDTGGPETDFADYSAFDFHLLDGAAGEAAGPMGQDIGAIPSTDPAGGSGSKFIFGGVVR